MKNLIFKSQFVVLLAGLLTFCVTPMWGADSEVTWNISGVNTTANGAVVNTTLKTSSVNPSTETGTWTAVSSANSYAGTNSGAQLGSSSYSFNGTVSLSGSKIPSNATIKSVKVTCRSGGSYTLSVNVGGKQLGSPITINSTTAAEKTFSGSLTGNNITLNLSTSATKYFAISKIIVTYSNASTPYTVTFNAGINGTCSTSSLTEASAGAGVTLPNVTAKTGYRFVGWSTSSTPTSANAGKAGDTYKPSANTTLYAYCIQTHIVNWYVNGSATPVMVDHGTDLAIPDDIDTDIDCNGKVFVGWCTTASYSNASTAPTGMFTSASGAVDSDANYYAVFATEEDSGDPVETKTQTLQYDTWTYSGSTTDKSSSSYRLFHSGSYIESASFDRSKLCKVIVYGGTFGGDSYNKLTIGDGTNTWKSVTVSGSSQTGVNTYTGGTALSGTGTIRITSNSGSASSNGVRISKIEIFTMEGGSTYTDYITTCSEPTQCAAPTFSLAAGNYATGAQSVTISCTTDGATIHYTTDGSAPTSSSATYSSAINVDRDMTIKAIAVKDGLTNSEVASAAYTITYPVSFNLNGKTGTVPTTQNISYNGTASEPTDPEVTGYTFGGWYTEGACTNAYNFSTGVMAAKELFAKWTAATYTITYKDKDDAEFSGTGWESEHPTMHTYNIATTLVRPTKTGYRFDGWYTTSACTEGAITSLGATAVTANITLYAKWTQMITISFLSNNETVKASVEIAAGGTLTEAQLAKGDIESCDDELTTFAGWTMDDAISEPTSTAPTLVTTSTVISETKTLRAVWMKEGGGIISFWLSDFDSDNKGTATEGSAITSNAKEGVTLSLTKGYVNTDIRNYSGGSFTFSCATSNITAIEFTTSTSKGKASDVTLTSGGGTYSYDGDSNVNGHWSGSSKSITFSNSSQQIQFRSITVTTDGDIGDPTLYITDCRVLPKTTITVYANNGIGESAPCVIKEGATTNLCYSTNYAGYEPTGYYTSVDGGVKVFESDGTIILNNVPYTDGSGWNYTNGSDNALDLYLHWTPAYVLVTDASTLREGDIVTIASMAGNSVEGQILGVQNTNNRIGVHSSTTARGQIAADSVAYPFTLVKNDDKWSFYGVKNVDAEPLVYGFLYATHSQTYLRTLDYMGADLNAGHNSNFSIAIDGETNVATINATLQKTDAVDETKTIRHNSSSNLFSTYASGQKDVYLYRMVDACGTPSSIEVIYDAQKDKRSYWQYDNLERDSKVLAHYDDGSCDKDITKLVHYSGFDSSTPVAEQTVTVSYMGVTTTITVEIKATNYIYYSDDMHGTEQTGVNDETKHYGTHVAPTLPDQTKITEGTCTETHYKFLGWNVRNIGPGQSLSADELRYTIVRGGTTINANGYGDGATLHAVWGEIDE